MFELLPPAETNPHLLRSVIDRAARAIPPLWPLSSSIAVNPFLGQSGESLAQAGARLARVAGAPVTMPRSWYREKISAGVITDRDLESALTNAAPALRPADIAALKIAAAQDAPRPVALPTIADLAAEAAGIDWPGLIAERIGAWAAGYFDEGQALWAAPRGRSAYAHEPLRLSVCVEAPREAITDVLSRHANVRALFDNGWLHLFTIDEKGRLAARYLGNLEWGEAAA